jgi:uncharacterized protein YndB with AHSA1/START domain
MTDRIEKTVELKAPVERVWRAVTDHEEFGQWFRVRLDQPFAAGAESTGTITQPGYEHMRWQAWVVAMEPMRLFAFTWSHATAAGGEDLRTRVEFRLAPIPGGTRLTIVESGFDALPDGLRDTLWRGNERGWTEQVGNIRAHVGG